MYETDYATNGGASSCQELSVASNARLTTLRAFAVGAVVAPIFVFIVHSWLSYRGAFSAAETRARQLTRVLEEHAQKVFETIELALEKVDERLKGIDWETIRTSRPLWEELRTLQSGFAQIGSIFVVDPEGNVPLTTRAYPAPTMSFSDRDYYQEQTEQNRGLYLGRTYIGRISQVPIFNLSIRRSTADGSFNGVIGSSAFVDYFQSFYSTAGLGEDNFAVLLFRADGHILARYPAAQVGATVPLPLTPLAASPGGMQIGYSTSSVDGLRHVYATYKVGSLPAYIAFSIDTRSIWMRWLKDVIASGLLALAASSVLFLLSFLALRHARAEQAVVTQLTESTTTLTNEIRRREQAESSLMQAQRLDAVGRLTGGIAHDFNNLLMIIKGNLTLAKKRVDSPVVIKQLASAEQAADRGADLTRQMLAFSRGQVLHETVLDLKTVLSQARSWISVATTESVELELDIVPELWNVRVDASELEAALLNLVVNARDAMGGQGKISIRAGNVPLPSVSLPEYPDLPAGDYVELSIADTGPGMAPEVVARVFEPFFTTKEVGKGSGLGLSRVHGFIRQSGGQIRIKTQEGAGTTFLLYLPRCTDEMVPQPESSTPFAMLDSSRTTVLLVEDNAGVRKLTSMMLDELGYTILLARNGVEALALLSTGEPVEVLITDFQLPRGMNGGALATRATALKPSLKVLVCTASLDVDVECPVLLKPFTIEQLAAALDQLLDGPG
jgi:two-component system NtrC family sensor kinase